MSKCKICRQEFIKRSMTHKTCGPDCAEKYGIEQARKNSEKKKRQEVMEERINIRERKEKLKSKFEVMKEVQVLCNRFVRERDLKAGYGCISCETKSSPRWDAGHFRSVGSAPHLRFDADRNIHLQCAKCNTFLSGNLLSYKDRLPERIGFTAFLALMSDQAPKQYTKDDLQELKAYFRKKLKDLKND